MDISTDPADSCALYITIHGHTSKQKKPALSGRFQFEDHIRCIAAKQVLQRSRDKLRFAKMTRIAKLLRLPVSNDMRLKSLAVPTLPSSSVHRLDQPVSIVRTSPAPEPSQITMSAVQRTFVPPGSIQRVNNQEIEMAALRYSTIFHTATSEEGVLDSSIRHSRVKPSLQDNTPTVELDPLMLGARWNRNSPSPAGSPIDTNFSLEPLESSLTEDCSPTSVEGSKAEGYTVERLEDSLDLPQQHKIRSESDQRDNLDSRPSEGDRECIPVSIGDTINEDLNVSHSLTVSSDITVAIDDPNSDIPESIEGPNVTMPTEGPQFELSTLSLSNGVNSCPDDQVTLDNNQSVTETVDQSTVPNEYTPVINDSTLSLPSPTDDHGDHGIQFV